WERQDNMEGAWELADGHKVAGKHVAIVDDVVTTGATIMACASQLIKVGNVRISVVCLGYAGKAP
ncbi:MAG: phosphoribosyltransferase family protein, partial [Prevotella sp.]|nr:phosphoribosyltransferase family protein [Prevotella sp.]